MTFSWTDKKDGETIFADDINSLANGVKEALGKIPVIDSELSDESENSVQNKVVKAELDKKYEASADAKYFLENLVQSGSNDVDFKGAFAAKELWTVDDKGNYTSIMALINDLQNNGAGESADIANAYIFKEPLTFPSYTDEGDGVSVRISSQNVRTDCIYVLNNTFSGAISFDTVFDIDYEYSFCSLVDDISGVGPGETVGIRFTEITTEYGYRLAFIVSRIKNADKKTATIVIGPSSARRMPKDVDYLCDGTADQTEINNAIAALPTGGGKIVLLEGVYNISGTINVNKDNVTIEGMGKGTVMKRMFNGEFIYVTGDKCEVSRISIDGNYGTYTGTSNHSITLMGATHCLIANNHIYNCYEGIYMAGDAFYNKIIANHVVDAANNSIVLYNAKKNIVADNTVINAKHCIYFDWYSEHNICKGNTCENPTTAGIHIQGNSTRNVISDNVVIKGDDTQYSIYLKNGYNIVANNQIPNMDYTNDGGTTNIFDNNMA